MNIYAPIGTKVKFLNKNGHSIERDMALEVGLIQEHDYVVSAIDVGSFSSRVYLEGFNCGFNTVMFSDSSDQHII